MVHVNPTFLIDYISPLDDTIFCFLVSYFCFLKSLVHRHSNWI